MTLPIRGARMRRLLPLLLAVFAAGIIVGHASATSRPQPVIPAYVFTPVSGESVGVEPDRAGTEEPPRDGASPMAGDASRRLSGLAYARMWALAVLGPREYACLSAIVERESGWRLNAVNRTSGAFGLFQGYPASKLDHYGRDPLGQMRFGIAYVTSRYGGACAARAFQRLHGWM